MSCISIEVIYALPDHVFHYLFRVNEGTCLLDAVRMSPLFIECPALNLQTATMGIFGKKIVDPVSYRLEHGDRIEIYRPLVLSPQALRKKRLLAKNNS